MRVIGFDVHAAAFKGGNILGNHGRYSGNLICDVVSYIGYADTLGAIKRCLGGIGVVFCLRSIG